jgi:nicotinate-nucleotide adenylyltransferase
MLVGHKTTDFSFHRKSRQTTAIQKEKSTEICYNDVGDVMHIVFGGSFNPPTIAHQHMIDQLKETFPQSRILILPVGDDYAKKALISIKHRIKMLELMIEGTENVLISDLEAKRTWKGTLASLDELSKVYDHIHFVIGSDQLSGLFEWIDYQRLLSTYPFIVMTRKGSPTQNETEHMFAHLPHRFQFIEFNQNISSTIVRNNIKKAAPYLKSTVYQYILDNHLYEETNHV